MTLPAEDVKQLRKLAADRDYQQARADEAEAQVTGWKNSSAHWKELYESEKDRADRVQGGRVDENAKAIVDLQTANKILHDQADADRKHIAELNSDIASLKSGRKWWLITGAVAGGAAGYFAGHRVGQAGGIVNVITGAPPTRPAFYTLHF